MMELKSHQNASLGRPWPVGEQPAARMATNAVDAKIERLALWIPCLPIAQPRQRHSVIAGHVRNYTPANHPVNAFKAACQVAADSEYRGGPWSGPIRMDVVFVFARPQSMVWKTKPMPRVWHASKPDRDNSMKSLMDALEGRIYVNDSQVCAGNVEKWIASGDEQPHVEVIFTKLKEVVD